MERTPHLGGGPGDRPAGRERLLVGELPWNRVAEVPSEQKALADLGAVRASGPVRARELLGDGNFGGDYQKPDADMLRLWEAGVEETREVIRGVA